MSIYTLYIKNKKIPTINGLPIYTKYTNNLPDGTRYFVIRNQHAYEYDNGDYQIWEKESSENIDFFNANLLYEHHPTIDDLGYSFPTNGGACLVDVTLENKELTVGYFKPETDAIRTNSPDPRTEQYFKDIITNYLLNIE